MFSDLISKFKDIRERATPQVKRPFYIGLGVGGVLAVLVFLGLLNTSSFTALPSSFEGVATSQAIWGLKPSNLMMVLPLGAFLVVLARSFIGLKAFGLFTPMLIALAFLQIGPVMGPLVLGASILVGMILAPALLKLRMTRVGFLGVLISLIVLTLVALQLILDRQLQVDAFPVVVCALVVERWWRQWEKDGAYEAARLALNTFLVSIVIQFVMVSNLALILIEWSPLLMPAFTAIAIAILGRYRGLRVTEIHRFAPIWLERRRAAKEREAAECEAVPDSDVDVAPDTPPPIPPPRHAEAQGDLLHQTVWTINSVNDVLYAKKTLVDKIRTNPPMVVDEAPVEPRVRASERLPVDETWVIGSLGDVVDPPRPWRKKKINPERVAQHAARVDARTAKARAEEARARNARAKSWTIRSVEDV